MGSVVACACCGTVFWSSEIFSEDSVFSVISVSCTILEGTQPDEGFTRDQLGNGRLIALVQGTSSFDLDKWLKVYAVEIDRRSLIEVSQTVVVVEILEAGLPNISEGLDQPNDDESQGGRPPMILFN